MNKKMVSLWQDIRYGFRMLVRNPGFTVVVVLVLALGIGTNTVFFSVVNAVLLRPLAFDNPEQLVMLNQHNPQHGLTNSSPGAFAQWRARNTAFEYMAAYEGRSFALTGSGEAEVVGGTYVSWCFFNVLGIKPFMGRYFLPDMEEPGNENVAVLSYGLWQRRFGADPNVIGKTIRVDGVTRSVIGVLPSGFSYPPLKGADLWAPLALSEWYKTNYHMHYLQVVARLKHDVTIEQADAEMDVIASQIEQEFPDGNRGFSGVFVQLLHERIIGGIDEHLTTLFVVVTVVLLIACVNVAGLLLARVPVRQKEIALRKALGAGQLRIVQQLLTESVTLAMLGGGLGLACSFWTMELVRTWIPPGIPRVNEIDIDVRVLGFTVIVSILAGVLFGLTPALQLGRNSVIAYLKDAGTRISGGGRIRRLRSVLVISEIAMAVVLLVGGGLLFRSLINLTTTAPGFKPDQVLTIHLQLPPHGSSRTRALSFFEQIVERVELLPEVRSVAVVDSLPTKDASRWSAVADTDIGQDKDPPQAAYRSAGPGYFRTMGIPLLQGRDFSEQDTQGKTNVVIINTRLALRCWPDDDPMGKRLKPGGPESQHPWLTVVGVIANTTDPLNHAYDCEMYRPIYQHPRYGMNLVARTNGDPMDLVRHIRDQIADLEPDVPVSHISTMRRVLSGNLSYHRFIATLPTIFALIALLLAAIGLYGTMSYSVAQRTHEIGIRMALGARMRDVLQMILGQGLKLALIGLCVGLAAAVVITRVIANGLYNVSLYDPVTYLLVSVLLIVVVLVACWIPARRAAKVDPMVALKSE
ncbi:ABC transporter permease [Planctomycetota bacterium]